jgi:hypothetical protein
MNNRPFGFDTLTIPAALVSDGDPASAYEAARTLGFDEIRLPVVLVPAGGEPPCDDYVMLGAMTQPTPARRADAPQDAREGSVDAVPLPRTRYRLGPGAPPKPSSAPDPVAVGIKTWRGMAGPARIELARDTDAPVARTALPPKAPMAQPVDDTAKKRLEATRIRAFLRLL